MAHVKVVRRSMRPEEWTDLRFTWLQRGIWADEEEITGLRVRDAHQISENAYEFVDGEERPLNRGDMMFTPDGTAFIRGTANIPERFAGQRVYLRLHTAAEMIVRVNGKLVGGIDPNRDAILLTPYIDRPELTIEIEAYNRSKPDDERNPASLSTRGCRQIFEGAFLCTRRENVQSLVYDYILFMDMAHSEYFNEDLRRYLFKELSKALDFVDFDTFEGVDEAARYVEEKIYQNTDFKGSGDVALVAHSHLDIAYYWRRIHAVQKNARTILIQLRLMDRYPEFRYTHTQAYTYETLEKYYPELFKELSARVAEGRFEPVGAMYVEPDCNIPAAESLIRQFLYGQHFFRRAFGKTVDNAWLPDVFGNSWILPQILRKCGVSYFVSNKMSTWNDTNRFPHNNFIWKGIDGTTVYACVPPTHFITWNMPSQVQENWEAYQDKETGGQTLQMYGYGDGGSGATEEMVELARRFPRVSAMPKVELTGGSEFLHRNFDGNQELATWDGELYLEMHRGTFTTKSNLKQLNRQMEFMLRNAELVLALRALSGKAYPGEELTEIYKKVLLNQFHDILPGSHIRPVYEDAMADYEEAKKRLRALLSEAVVPDRLFNSLNFDRTLVQFIPMDGGAFERDGVTGTYRALRIPALEAADVPKSDGAGNADWIQVCPAENGKVLVKTGKWKAALFEDGSFESLQDTSGREYVRAGAGFNKLHIWADHPGMYDAWDILPNYKDVELPVRVVKGLRLTKADAACAELTADLATEKRTWQMIIRFFASDDRVIEVEHQVDWHEKHRLAKVNFGPDVLTREIVCDTSAGYIRRSLTKNTSWEQARYEVCHHKWFDLSEPDGGVAVINSGKYGVGLEGDEVSLSLLRSTIRPDIESDMGRHSLRYLIVPHEGDHLAAKINRLAFEYNVPLVRAEPAVPEHLRQMLIGAPLWLQCLKISEDGQYLVIRLSEQDGRRGTLSLPVEMVRMNMLEDAEGPADRISYHPFELLTLGIPLEKLNRQA